MGWQPIETAPKDGSPVDLWMVDQEGAGYRVANAYWVEKSYDLSLRKDRSGWFAPGMDHEGEDGFCDKPDRLFSTPPGWGPKANAIVDKVVFTKVTHWMPIPKGPEGIT